jgi:hypothetical protein
VCQLSVWDFILCQLKTFSGHLQYILVKGRWSAKKFRKLQINKVAYLQKILYSDLPQVWQFAGLQFVDSLYFAICGFYDLGINEKKFADLKFANSHTSELLRICDCGLSPRICRFAICGLLILFVFTFHPSFRRIAPASTCDVSHLKVL